MIRQLSFAVAPVLIATYLPFCAADVKPVRTPQVPVESLWVDPVDLERRDLFHGPWGLEYAPDPGDTYRIVERKHSGINPGMTLVDPLRREWSVKQPSLDEPITEGPIEVVVSRVLSAAGYHQPPVFYMDRVTVTDDWGVHVEPGGRFRLKLKTLKDRGAWSWQQNPHVGTRPYQGLLVILLMFNSSDLKNANNTLYEHRGTEPVERWFVVRDLGTALGSTGRFVPRKGDARAFEREPYITGIHDGFVEFHYRGWHRELFARRITPADVAWASHLLGRLSEHQWREAFRAGGYSPAAAAPFIAALRAKVIEGQRLGPAGPPS